MRHSSRPRVATPDHCPSMLQHPIPGIDGEIPTVGAMGRGTFGEDTSDAVEPWHTEADRTMGLSLAPSTVGGYQKAIRELQELRSARGYPQSSPVPVDRPLQVCMKGRRPCLSVKSLRGSCPREKPQVLICGHSLVFGAGRRAATSSCGSQLGLSQWATLRWLGRCDMLWDELLPLLFGRGAVQAVPRLLVIHLGGNDLGQKKGIELIIQACNDLRLIRQRWPETRFVWSDLIPRQVWNCRDDPRGINRARKKMNRQVGSLVQELEGVVMHHPDIRRGKAELYQEDGVQLTDAGHDVFLADLQKCLLGQLQARWSKGF